MRVGIRSSIRNTQHGDVWRDSACLQHARRLHNLQAAGRCVHLDNSELHSLLRAILISICDGVWRNEREASGPKLFGVGRQIHWLIVEDQIVTQGLAEESDGFLLR